MFFTNQQLQGSCQEDFQPFMTKYPDIEAFRDREMQEHQEIMERLENKWLEEQEIM